MQTRGGRRRKPKEATRSPKLVTEFIRFTFFFLQNSSAAADLDPGLAPQAAEAPLLAPLPPFASAASSASWSMAAGATLSDPLLLETTSKTPEVFSAVDFKPKPEHGCGLEGTAGPGGGRRTTRARATAEPFLSAPAMSEGESSRARRLAGSEDEPPREALAFKAAPLSGDREITASAQALAAASSAAESAPARTVTTAAARAPRRAPRRRLRSSGTEEKEEGEGGGAPSSSFRPPSAVAFVAGSHSGEPGSDTRMRAGEGTRARSRRARRRRRRLPQRRATPRRRAESSFYSTAEKKEKEKEREKMLRCRPPRTRGRASSSSGRSRGTTP